MPHSPLPEAIRGCWFFIPDAHPQHQSGQKNSSIIHFNLDGSFERFQIKENDRKPVEQGTYTFDGRFLILRTRNTDTYRVHRKDFCTWAIEGKKDGQALVRGYPLHFSSTELSAAAQKDIHTLPLRVSVTDDFTHAVFPRMPDGSSNGIYQLRHKTGERTHESIANFFVEFHPDNRLWIGLSPFAKNIEPATWQRIIHDCYLDIYLNKPSEIDTVTLVLLDSNDAQTFRYDPAS